MGTITHVREPFLHTQQLVAPPPAALQAPASSVLPLTRFTYERRRVLPLSGAPWVATMTGSPSPGDSENLLGLLSRYPLVSRIRSRHLQLALF